jgi:hypothetical protein
MSLPTVRAFLAAALFSVVVSLPFMPFAASPAAFFRFEVTVTSTQTGVAQFFYDIGHGIREEDSARALVAGGDKKQVLRFDLPAGRFAALRFDPLNRASTLTIANAVVCDSIGREIRRFGASEFRPDRDIAKIQPAPDGTLHLELASDSTDPITHIDLPEPLLLKPELTNVGPALFRVTLPIFLCTVFFLAALSHTPPKIRRSLRARLAALVAKPARAISVTAVVAVIASSYPIVFLGKSLVSPNQNVLLLYDSMPTLPGYRDAEIEDVKGADIGALMWSHIPLSTVEAGALFHDHELPLWNRYNSAGTTLLGQGQSMLGDPLHFLVLFANGASWAWDLKFLVAKWLLAAGVGLCVWRATRHLPAAAIVAAIMPFIGHFIFRVNHPAIFSLCYAPLILLSWLGIVAASHWRGAAAWVGGLMLANWTEMNSGTVKEAYMSLLTLNWVGAVILACASFPIREKVRRFGIATAGGMIFFLLSAPIWLTFLDALAKSYTSYNAASAFQVQPSLALAFFDEILFRPFWEKEQVYNGSVNFLVLLGVLAFLVNLRRICAADRLAFGLVVGLLLPLALIFGVIPPTWIVRVPFLANVAHIDNSFFCPTITLLGVLAGYGFRAAAQRLGKPEGRGDLALGGLLFGVLIGNYLAFGHVVQRSTYSYWHWGEHIALSPFVVGDLIALIVAAVGLSLTVRWMLVRKHASAASIMLLATFAVIVLWRHGLHAQIGFSDYVLSPRTRVDFHAPSPAITAARADQQNEPWRFVGLNGNAFHGWMNVYEFEGVGGPDALMNMHYRELQDAFGLERLMDWRIYAQASTLAGQKRAFDFFNVRHYFDYQTSPATLRGMLTPVKMGDLDVYRSETAWPRAFFTDRVVMYSKVEELATLVKQGDGRPFAAVQRGDAEPNLPSELNGRSVVPALHYRLTHNTTSFDVNASGPGVVVLEEAWLRKDFHARVDGKRVPYVRFNHAFKGVAIESAGVHHVEFEYWPRRFTEALIMSATGILLLVGSAWFLIGRRPLPADSTAVTELPSTFAVS